MGSAQLFRTDYLAAGGFHPRRTAQTDRALLADDKAHIGHRRHIGASGGAGAHHNGYLRDTLSR
jgi:hypothetical protein